MEDEITKHTKNIYHEMKNDQHSFKEKIKEIIIEVCTIVFAVTLSIWLHGWSEHRHEQKEVKDFLSNLKTDLIAEAKLTENSSNYFKEINERFTFLSKLDKGKKPNLDSLNHYFDEYYGSPTALTISSRYDGFKSSGKLGLIENPILAQDILDLYQVDMPSFKSPIQSWNEQRYKLRDFVTDNLVRNPNGTDNRFQVLAMPKAKNLCISLIPWDQLFERHNMLLKKIEKILKEIDEELKE